MVKVLVACEFSGIVREAMKAVDCDAWSCDLLPSEKRGQHIEGNVLDVLNDGWDLMIAHPPCQYLAGSGARWKYEKAEWEKKQEKALEFVQALLDAPIPCIALENPVSIISTRIRKPDQYIQPWQFGHGEMKKTCFWLKNLLPLTPTHTVEDRQEKVYRCSPGPNRWRTRSRTYKGIAAAMAAQWAKEAEETKGWLIKF